MYCGKCGEPVVQNSKFCAKCGAMLLPSAPSTVQLKAMLTIENASAESRVRPWVRYWARMFDLYFFSLIGGAILGFAAPQFLARLNEYALGMLLVFIWLFVESLLLTIFQTTPGKWLFKTKIALASGSPISFSQALTRSLKVWWRGLGTGFPIAAMITMIIAHGRLTRNGITSWDKDDGFLVTHNTIGVPRILAAIAFAFIFLMVVAIENNIHKPQSSQTPHVSSSSQHQYTPDAEQPPLVSKPTYNSEGWTQESTGSTEVGPWLDYSPPGTRFYRDASRTIYRVYPPGVMPNAEKANPFGLGDSTEHVPQ